jgi:glyceraldehyde 3-phosphate dehydrogenase
MYRPSGGLQASIAIDPADPRGAAKIFGWYDNEYGSYTNRLGDLTVYIHKSLFR